MAETAVAIIGGGISGLSAAFTLEKLGVPYLLLEAERGLGGVIRTESRDGFLLEGGPDSIFAQKPEGLALVRELGLGERLARTNPEQRAVYVLRKGRLHALPDGMALAVPTKVLPFLRSGLFSWPGKLRMGLDVLIPGRNGDGDESIASFLGRRFGREAIERLGEPLLAGIHAGDPERLSILATFPRFREMERRHGSLVRAMWAVPRPRPKPGEPPPAAFYTLRGGLRELVDALVLRLPREKLCTKTRVRRVERQGGGEYLLCLDRQGTLTAERVIVAAPGPRVCAALEGLAPEVARALAAIPFASSATVQLGYRREDVAHPLDGFGMVVPKGEGLRTTALSFASTKFPYRAPAGHVLLRGYLGGVRDGAVLELRDEEMVETVRREMKDVLGLRGRPVMTRVFRFPGGTPQLEVGHLQRMVEVERALHERAPGVLLTGAGVRSTGIPDAVADASRVAAAAAEGLR